MAERCPFLAEICTRFLILPATPATNALAVAASCLSTLKDETNFDFAWQAHKNTNQTT